MKPAFAPILLFDPGGAILPPRPQSDCAIVSSGGQGWPRFSRPPEGLVLDGREHDGTLAVSERKTTMRGSGARLVTTAIVAASRFPFPQSLPKSGNSNREAHQLSRFREHQTACSCLRAPAAHRLFCPSPPRLSRCSLRQRRPRKRN